MSEKYSLADVQSAVAAVKYGHDPEAADTLIRHFATLLKEDEDNLFAHHNLSGMEREFLRFVGMGFTRYAEGKRLEAAFGLKRSRGQRNRPDITDRNLVIAAFVELKMRRGSRWQDAIGDAANKFFGVTGGMQACEDAYAEHKDAMRLLQDDALEDALKDLAT